MLKYLDEYRDKDLAQNLVAQINYASKKSIRIMEVCGGHTMAIRKYGIQNLLPPTIKLLSGPGCPVCVTSRSFIDKAIAYSAMPDIIITTYGDLMRVPGTSSSLLKEKARGADVRIVVSTLDAVKIAKENPEKTVIFLGIGFETTTPPTAIAVLEASKIKLKNFLILSAHKLMPPAMAALIDEGTLIDAYIGPGHVSTIAGSKIYKPLVNQYDISVVISGFEPVDILQSIWMLVKQIESGIPSVEIQYSRAVSQEGNLKAQNLVNDVFEPCTAFWRGLGAIPKSGLKLKPEYNSFEAESLLPLEIAEKPEPKGCLCGQILKGQKIPTDCKLFGKTCTPEKPVGACMVSDEGTCAAYFKYNDY
ncbi:MAG: hydrogenase formation protein HypD [Bacteroidota bacterium]|nr:MAG: hydrogenase formation protein HypD [Bacteroidota bacterium]